MDKLAINGGDPVSSKWIPLTKPFIGEEEKKEVLDTLDSGWLSRGPKVTRFENNFAKFIGVNHAIGVSSCTAALHTALVAAGITRNDEVITSPITFPATSNVILYERAKPVFVDVLSRTFNIDPCLIEEKITKKTRAIIPVHIAGQACDMDVILDIAKKYKLFVLEDSAHGAGAFYKGKHLGSIGDAGAFSFYASKNITTGDGGMLTIREDDELANYSRVLSLHGMSTDAWKRYTKEGDSNWSLIYPGFKYNMTDIEASIGIHQLNKINSITEARTRIAGIYTNELQSTEEILLPYVDPHCTPNWHLYIITLNLRMLKYSRDDIVKMLKAENIGVGIHFVSVPKQPYYKEVFNYTDGDFPAASWVSDRIISLPLFPQMSDEEIYGVINAVKKVIGFARK